ncbi:MAG TPA: peptidyl-prolyl cis-trans isomerase [Holophagaceae bacterium]|nr:peptidyl-prolyl cis-trans isomerase [Holophagaceae bacterium]
MLRDFRKFFKSQGTTVGGLMLLLTLGMLAYLVPSGQASQAPETVVGRVYGREILRREVEEALAKMAQRYGKGQNVDSLLPFLRPQAVQQVVQERLVEELAERHNVVVTDPEVRAALEARLRQYPVFLDERGQLKPVAEISDILRQNGLTLPMWEKEVRSDLVRRKLVEQVALKVPMDADWLQVENRVRHEKLGFDQITFTVDTASVADPGDAALATFLQAGGSRFMQGKRRVAQVVSLDAATLGDLKVSDEELKKTYEQRKAVYSTPAQVKARHILFKAASDTEIAAAMKKAEELRAKLVKGLDFAKTAEEQSEDPSAKGNGGDLGWFDASKMVKEFSDAAFKMKPGEISQPVKTQFGVHLIKVEGVKPETVKSFDEVKEQLRADLQSDRFNARATEKLEQLRKRAGGGDLSAAARALGLKAVLSQPFAQDAASVKVEGLTDTATLVSGAFGLKVGEVSKPARMGDRYAVYRVQEELPPTVPPLAEIRDKVLAAWKVEEARKQLKAKVEEGLKKGFDTLASLGGAKDTKTDALLSGLPDLNAQGAIRKALLDTPVGQVTPILWNDQGKLWVARLNARTPAPALDFEGRRALVQEIQGQEAQKQLGAELQFLDEQGRLHPGLSSLWGHLDGIWVSEDYVKPPAN